MSGPHFTHATVVLNFDDGSKRVYLLGGGPDTECVVETEINHEEVHSARLFHPVALIPVDWDVTFKFTGVVDFVPPPSEAPAQITSVRQVEP